MVRSRLFATLLSFSFALQVVLAGTGSTCVLPSGTAQGVASTAGAGMADMPMPGMDMGANPSDDGAPARSHGHDSGGAPCDQPGTPAACWVTAPCAGGFVAIAATGDASFAGASAAVVAWTVTMPPSRTTPPELPPPRA
jgi:hypothetical protein